MGEILLHSSHSWKSTAFALSLLSFVGSDLSPVWAEQIIDISATVFLADPDQILLENPDGGARLAVEVRDLALSDPTTLQSILGLLPKASKAQKAAIGAGLAQAARVSARSNPGYAKEIQQAVVRTKDGELIEAYDATATGEFSGLIKGRTGLGSVSDTAAAAGFGAPGTTFGAPPVFAPGNSVFSATTVPSTNVPLPGGEETVPGAVTAVEVPNVPTPNIPAPNVAESGLPETETSIPAPNIPVPNVTVSSLALSSVTVPNVSVPTVAVTAFAVLPSFAPPPTPLSESVSPH
jgi:catechol 2,3-dioxygenase-like lactoylglutathione lyase family enzyme